MTSMEYIRKALTETELLLQLAEECNELAKAALKLRRTITKENPTPVSEIEARKGLREEIADVLLCLEVLRMDDYNADYSDIWLFKVKRWADRLREVRTTEQT